MNYINQSMQRKIVFVVAIFLLLVSVISIFVQIQNINQTATANFERRLKELARLFSVVMASPVSLDRTGKQTLLKTNTEAMFADLNLLKANVYLFDDNKKKFYFTVYRDSESKNKVIFSQEDKSIHFSDVIQRQIPVFKVNQLSRNDVAHLIHDPFTPKADREIIGYVEITYSTTSFNQQRNSAIIGSTINTALSFGVIFIVLSLLLKKLVSDPLNKVSRFIRAIAAGDYSQKIDFYHSPDELGEMIASSDSMRKSIRKKIGDLHDINIISELMAKEYDQEKALKAGLKVMEEHTGVLRGSVYLLNKDSGKLEFKACYPHEEDQNNPPASFQLGEGIAGKVAETKKFIFIEDTSRDDQFITNPDQKVTPMSLLCVPMLDENKIYGIMNFSGSINAVHFEEDVQEFADTVARMMVISCKNIIMVNIIEEQNKNLEQKVSERTDELKSANIELEKEIELRKKAEARLQEFLQAHEIIGDGLIQEHFKKYLEK